MLCLKEKENYIIEIDDEVIVEVQSKWETCLVGKVCTKRAISKEVIVTTMVKVWRVSKSSIFKYLGNNVFIITFEIHADKQKVEGGHPGLFDIVYFASFDGIIQPSQMRFDQEQLWV